MSRERRDADPHSLTGVFGKERARWIRWAIWVRQQFSATSLTVIGVILMAAWTYISNLNSYIGKVETRVVVLETEVVPDLKLKEKVATLELHDANHEARIQDLERNYDFARTHAGDPPIRRPR